MMECPPSPSTVAEVSTFALTSYGGQVRLRWRLPASGGATGDRGYAGQDGAQVPSGFAEASPDRSEDGMECLLLDPGYWILAKQEESALRPHQAISSVNGPA
jgi:hypothetical protein